MDNRKYYKFDDFTLTNYVKILRLAQSSDYKFCNYFNYKDTDNFILWRHDIEFSPEIALKMAIIEAELGIQTNYFINIHSEFYSVFEKDTFAELKKIIELEHFVGLHFDAHFYDLKNENELCQKLSFERDLLEKMFNITITAFAFHNTTPEILKWNNYKYADMINVYSLFFREEVDYCTDSTGIWRYERLEDNIKEKHPNGLQVLTHDGMWQDEAMSPRKRVFKCIDDRADKLKEYYDYLLKKYHQKNVDDEQVY